MQPETKLQCQRCGFGSGPTQWLTRLPLGQLPVRCPRCSSIKWNVLPVAKEATTQ